MNQAKHDEQTHHTQTDEFGNTATEHHQSNGGDKTRGEHKMITILLILFVFGFLGFHRLYLGHLKSGFAQLFSAIAGWVLLFVGLAVVPTNAAGEVEFVGAGLALFVVGIVLLIGVALSVFIDFILILIDKMKDSKGYYIQR